MVGSWASRRLGEVVTLQRGFDLPAQDRQPGRVPIVSSSGITGTHCEARVPAPGVVTGRYGTIGRVFYLERDFWPLNTTLYVRDFHGNDPKFVSYLLMSLDFSGFSDKSSVPGVNRNHLHQMPVMIPPIAVQKTIASILGVLDDKIALNRRMNETLGAMIDAYFQASISQRGAALDGTTVTPDLEGPRDALLGEVVTLQRGFDLPQQRRMGGTVPIVSSAGPTGSHDVPRVAGPGVVTGRYGTIGSVHYVREDFWPLNTTLYVKDFKGNDPLIVSCLLRTVQFKSVSDKSSVPGVNRNDLHRLPVRVPSQSQQQAMAPTLHLWDRLISQNERQSRTLESLRDGLLPRLLSGELRVGGAEPAVELAV